MKKTDPWKPQMKRVIRDALEKAYPLAEAINTGYADRVRLVINGKLAYRITIRREIDWPTSSFNEWPDRETVMKPAPTLMDHVYRASYSNEPIFGWTNNALWRDALRRARRFVLDDEMSIFLGELGSQAFANYRKLKPGVVNRMCEHLRMGSRLPSEVTWIEYNLRACQKRSSEVLGRTPTAPHEMPAREGWLLMRHPSIPTAFRAHIVSHDPDIDHGDGYDSWTFPVALGWTVDMETVLPWRAIPVQRSYAVDKDGHPVVSGGHRRREGTASECSTGILGYQTDRVAYVFSDMIDTPMGQAKAISEIVADWAGVQRRIWALLSTINDLPVLVTDVRASKGFIGRHAYRKFLDHKTITLTVPQTMYRKVIRSALSLVHRRGGPVREHWRRDWRNPLSPLCEHEWSADEKHMFCTICKGRKIWVIEHVRGDTSVGFVTHDYVVTHGKEKAHG